jgi:hypothetical protein
MGANRAVLVVGVPWKGRFLSSQLPGRPGGGAGRSLLYPIDPGRGP